MTDSYYLTSRFTMMKLQQSRQFDIGERIDTQGNRTESPETNPHK